MNVRKVRTRKPAVTRSGFILLTVIILLMLVSLILTRVAIVSLRKVGEVQANEQELQQRWAVTSLRQYCERAASSLLSPQRGADSGTLRQGEVSAVAFEQLAGIDWEIWVQNESAKLNPAWAVEQRPLKDVLEALGGVIPKGGPGRLRTANEIAYFSPESRGSFEYWLEAKTGASYRQLTEDMTLWGDGRLDVLSARSEVLDAAWRLYFGRSAPAELHALKDQQQVPVWRNVLQAVSLRESELAIANRNFTVGRSVTSVWLIPPRGSAIPSYFFVRWGGNGVAMQSKGYLY